MVPVKSETIEGPASEAQAAVVLQLFEALGHRAGDVGEVRIVPDRRGVDGIGIIVKKVVRDRQGQAVRI